MTDVPFIREQKIDGVRVLRLGANLTFSNYRELKTVFENLQGTNDCQVVLDLRDCSYMDSAGLGLLASFVSSFRTRGGDIRLLYVPTPLKDTLMVTKLIKFFKLFADETDAVKSFEADRASR